jgi:hypothetical protein
MGKPVADIIVDDRAVASLDEAVDAVRRGWRGDT